MDQPPHGRAEAFLVDDAPLLRFHKRLALYSGGGPFLDGYVLSVIGIAMVQVTPQWGLNSAQQGLIAASATIGIFFGSFLGGRLTDHFGRRRLYTVDLIAVIVFSAAQLWVDDFWWLFLLRSDRSSNRGGLSRRRLTFDRVHPEEVPRPLHRFPHCDVVRRCRVRIPGR